MDVSERNKLLGKIGRAIGGEAALVLFDLIETFPDRACLIGGQAWARADPGAYRKLGMASKKYQDAINGLIGLKYIDRCVGKVKTTELFFRVNFEALEKYKSGAVEVLQHTVLGDKLLRKIAKDNMADGIKYEITRDGESQ